MINRIIFQKKVIMKIKTWHFFGILMVFSLISGCGPTSVADYQTLAISEMNSFTRLLKKIHDPKELKKKQNKIKIHFNSISKVMISYRSYLEKHPEASDRSCEKLQVAAGFLKSELYRIYELDGGLNIIEEAQRDAYIKISLFENSLTQERIDMFKSNRPLFKD
jgi:hypothetical protein